MRTDLVTPGSVDLGRIAIGVLVHAEPKHACSLKALVRAERVARPDVRSQLRGHGPRVRRGADTGQGPTPTTVEAACWLVWNHLEIAAVPAMVLRASAGRPRRFWA